MIGITYRYGLWVTCLLSNCGQFFVQQFEEQGQLARRAAADGPSGQAAMAAAVTIDTPTKNSKRVASSFPNASPEVLRVEVKIIL